MDGLKFEWGVGGGGEAITSISFCNAVGLDEVPRFVFIREHMK